jgi:PKD repeat protein
MKLPLLSFLLLFYFPIALHAQHEADNWYFGKKSGVSFSSGTATSLSDGQLSTLEGCAAISDAKTGALIFYTDGITVWNSKHTVMQNGTGLKGGFSATQSTLIVPNPANKLQYYIFTVSESESGSSDLSYSIVSLEASDGIVLTKNTLLIDGISEKLTGTKDCAGKGYWIITHARQTGTFYSFHVTSAGISTNPAISRYLPDISNFTGGYIKISPNRTKLALASTVTGGFLALFDFNPNTGVLSNYMRLNAPLTGNSFYGVTFSPDNSKIYASAIGVINYIYQYEVNLPDSTSIRNSLTILSSGAFVAALQLAPDGKIYTTQNGGTYIGVINEPNLKGTACGYQTNAVKLASQCYLGLPNFMDYVFDTTGAHLNPLISCLPPEAKVESDSGCVGHPLTFTDRSTMNPTSREWTFENGTPSTSTAGIVSVSYSTPGIYRVVLIVHNENGSDTVVTQAVVYPFPKASAGADRTLCYGEQLSLGTVADSSFTYSWQPTAGLDDSSKANPTATPSQSTTYILTVSSAGQCFAMDTVVLTVDSLFTTVSQDTTICSGESTRLLAQGGDTYRWSPVTGLDNPTISNPIAHPDTTTTYTVFISRGSCQDSATITINVTERPIPVVSKDQSICSGESTRLLAEGGDHYQWSPVTGLDNPNIPNPIATPRTTTTYTVYISRGSCIDSASVRIQVTESPIADAGASQTICAGEKVLLGQPQVAGHQYFWSPTNGLSNPTAAQPIASPTITTTYILKVVNAGGCASYDTLLLTVTPANLLAFTLSPDTISFMPGQQCTARIHIPKFTSDWHLRLNYDPRIITFTNIYQTTGGISMRAPRAIKDTLFLSGTGDDGEMKLDFRTFLPYSTDTIFPMHLSIDTANATNCDSMVTLPSGGIVLSLGGICGKGFRAAEETGKSYFLISKAHTVEFGVGLAGHVRLDVFDDLGSLIQTPLDTYLPVGEYSSTIDLPTGVYFWRIRAGMYQQVVPMVVVR